MIISNSTTDTSTNQQSYFIPSHAACLFAAIRTMGSIVSVKHLHNPVQRCAKRINLDHHKNNGSGSKNSQNLSWLVIPPKK